MLYFECVKRLHKTNRHERENGSGGIEWILSCVPSLRLKSLVLSLSRNPHNPEVLDTSETVGYTSRLMNQNPWS